VVINFLILNDICYFYITKTSKAIQQHVDNEDKGTLPIREAAYETRAVFINGSGPLLPGALLEAATGLAVQAMGRERKSS
jgi:hypothetical protein